LQRTTKTGSPLLTRVGHKAGGVADFALDLAFPADFFETKLNKPITSDTVVAVRRPKAA
jgi:hypothetical protein